MKSENGITLLSLIVYILLLVIITSLIGTISTYFYKNITRTNEDSKSVSSFNKFNMYFIEEVKKENNKVEQISNDMSYISFKSGDSFIYKNNKIYFNGVDICDDVYSASFRFFEEEGNINNNIIVVNIQIGKEFSYSKTMNYVIENTGV